MLATILGMAVLALHLPAQSLRRLVLDKALTDSPLRVCPLKSDSTSYLVGIPADENIRPGQAYSYLQPRIDVEALAKIEHTQVPAGYFGSFDATLRAARMYDGLIIAYIAMLSYPDLAAEMADVLLRLESQSVFAQGTEQWYNAGWLAWPGSGTSAIWHNNLLVPLTSTGGRGTDPCDARRCAIARPTVVVVPNTGEGMQISTFACLVRE